MAQPAYVTTPQQPPMGADQFGGQKEFAVSCFEIGDVPTCIMSWLFPPCMLGWARNKMDGSDCFVTCFNANPVSLRWLTRSAYNIQGSCVDDCLMALFCAPCSVNQIAQTALKYGRAQPDVGPEHNRSSFMPTDGADCCSNCMYSAFCLPCAIGTSMQLSTGMPFFMGCMCTNVCLARSVMRYHYRINGSDCCEDCFAPYGVCIGAYVCSVFIPCLYCVICPYFVGMVMNLLNESKRRGNPKAGGEQDPGSYLHPLPPMVAPGMTAPLPPGTVMYAQQPVQYAAQPQVQYAAQPAVQYAQNPGAQYPGQPAGVQLQPVAAAQPVVATAQPVVGGQDYSAYPAVKSM